MAKTQVVSDIINPGYDQMDAVNLNTFQGTYGGRTDYFGQPIKAPRARTYQSTAERLAQQPTFTDYSKGQALDLSSNQSEYFPDIVFSDPFYSKIVQEFAPAFRMETDDDLSFDYVMNNLERKMWQLENSQKATEAVENQLRLSIPKFNYQQYTPEPELTTGQKIGRWAQRVNFVMTDDKINLTMPERIGAATALTGHPSLALFAEKAKPFGYGAFKTFETPLRWVNIMYNGTTMEDDPRLSWDDRMLKFLDYEPGWFGNLLGLAGSIIGDYTMARGLGLSTSPKYLSRVFTTWGAVGGIRGGMQAMDVEQAYAEHPDLKTAFFKGGLTTGAVEGGAAYLFGGIFKGAGKFFKGGEAVDDVINRRYALDYADDIRLLNEPDYISVKATRVNKPPLPPYRKKLGQGIPSEKLTPEMAQDLVNIGHPAAQNLGRQRKVFYMPGQMPKQIEPAWEFWFNGKKYTVAGFMKGKSVDFVDPKVKLWHNGQLMSIDEIKRSFGILSPEEVQKLVNQGHPSTRGLGVRRRFYMKGKTQKLLTGSVDDSSKPLHSVSDEAHWARKERIIQDIYDDGLDDAFKADKTAGVGDDTFKAEADDIFGQPKSTGPKKTKGFAETQDAQFVDETIDDIADDAVGMSDEDIAQAVDDASEKVAEDMSEARVSGLTDDEIAEIKGIEKKGSKIFGKVGDFFHQMFAEAPENTTRRGLYELYHRYIKSLPQDVLEAVEKNKAGKSYAARRMEKFLRLNKELSESQDAWLSHSTNRKLLTDYLLDNAKLDELPDFIRPAIKMGKQDFINNTNKLIAQMRLDGLDELADLIEKNKGKYLPRLYNVFSKKYGMTTKSIFTDMRAFSPRKDAFIIYNKGGKKPLGKFVGYGDMVDDFYNKEFQTYARREMAAIRKTLSGESKAVRARATKARASELLEEYHKFKVKLMEFIEADKPEVVLKMGKNGKSFKMTSPIPQELLNSKYEMIDDPLYRLVFANMRTTTMAKNFELYRGLAKHANKLENGLEVDEVLKSQFAKQGLKYIPNSARYGALRHSTLPEKIADEVLSVGQTMDELHGTYLHYMRAWKSSKTVWNPGTHVHNTIGNVMFASFAETSPFNPRNAKYYKKAMNIITTRGDEYDDLVKKALIGFEQYGVEMDDVFSKLDDLIRHSPGTNLPVESADWWTRLNDKFKFKVKEADRALGTVYSAEDQIYKIAAYLKQIDKGASPDDAVRFVHKWFPNYERVSPFTRKWRNSILGSPFLSFTDQALKIGGRAAREKPITLASFVMLPYAMNKASQLAIGASPYELDMLKTPNKALDYFMPLLPWRDDKGRMVRFDMRYITPLAIDLVPRLKDVGADLPFIFHNPIMNAALEVLTGRNQFTGKPILNSDKKWANVAFSAAHGLLTQVTPAPTHFYYGGKRIAKQLQGKQTIDTGLLGATLSLVGISARAPYIDRMRLLDNAKNAWDDGKGMDDVINQMVLYNNRYRVGEQKPLTFQSLKSSLAHHSRLKREKERK
jgi:hypothetical protein